LRPFDLEAIARAPFDPTDYQGTLYVAPSVAELKSQLLAWLRRAAS
jgi:phenylalanine-4-hydroxylase